MKSCYNIIGWLSILFGVMVGLLGCTDELFYSSNVGTPSDVVCFTASLSNPHSASQTRSASGHLEIEQGEWLVGTEQSVSRGTPVTLLEGSAGVIGYVYDTWQEHSSAVGETPAITGTLPWETLYNKEFKFDGDELTAASNNVRWNTLNEDSAKFYVYAPYSLTGGTLSSEEQGGSPQLTYIVNDTPTEQNDLIVASWKGKTSYKQSIPLVFNHALTAVRFKVGFDCIVKSLEVKGICNSGTYTFGDGWAITQTPKDYTFNFGENGSGQAFSANTFLTDGNNTLMMIPQKLSSNAKVILTYIEGGTEKTIPSTLKDKVWQEGKMITYTIHKNAAPQTVYFDLAAGNVELGRAATAEDVTNYSSYIADLKVNDDIYVGFIYVNGEAKPVVGKHSSTNQYYVYQSSTSTDTKFSDYIAAKTGYKDESDYNSQSNCRIPDYAPVKLSDGTFWKDYITNNTSVEDVIETWDDGNLVRVDGQSASCEKNKLKNIKVVRDVGRTHTKNYIKVSGNGNSTKYNLTIDNIYTIKQVPVISTAFRSRTEGGIAYIPSGNTELIINLLGDSRMGCIHIQNTPTDKVVLQGTGSLTVADADFRTISDSKSAGYDNSDFGDTDGYISNFWNSAIGNNTNDKSATKPYNENLYNFYINSGVIFAGTTKAEDCSAIGGGGNGFGQVYITGGNVTAVATTAGTAIGGGMGHTATGGPGEVYIIGGNIYAYNFANRWGIPSSAIGGGSSDKNVGREGSVSISGGYVYAYSALGTAIGGGSSKTVTGGNATITVSGGQVIAKSGQGAGIGGGSSRTGGGSAVGVSYNGGTATINISGNPIIRTGSIGGGTTGDSAGKLGYAKITVSGGDIQAQFVMEAGSTGTPTFEMSGGTIRNSYVNDNEYFHTKKFGGAVYLEDGTFTMSGGTIKNCSAVQGGAVYIARKSEEPLAEDEFNFKMEGGEIHSCFATGGKIDDIAYLGHGGAICLDGGQIHMWGGKIWNNYSENGNGGAVYISNGNFIMKNLSRIITDNYPTITGNAAHKGNGGGVFVSSENGKSVKVDLLQGIITNNTANNYGGGICVDMGETQNSANVTVGMTGQGVTEETANPKISENMAMMAGGGLYARGMNANITINSGMIDENKVSAYVKNENVANEKGGVTLNDGLVTHVVVTFDGNGGKEGETETYTQKIVTNTNSRLTPNRFKRNGFKFVGWNNRPDGLGKKIYTADPNNPNQVVEVVPLSENITLYAQWGAIQ